jgi:CRISPR-associated endonuclease Cas2
MAHAVPTPQLPWGWRSMWVIAMFDLPTDTKKARRAYARFRKDLLEDGFTMTQYSVYSRHCSKTTSATARPPVVAKRETAAIRSEMSRLLALVSVVAKRETAAIRSTKGYVGLANRVVAKRETAAIRSRLIATLSTRRGGAGLDRTKARTRTGNRLTLARKYCNVQIYSVAASGDPDRGRPCRSFTS